MTQKDKELLLKDLCARLPYGVKVNNEIQGDFNIYGICENFVFGRNEVCHIDFDIEKIKPYLFPFSSMTKEQHKEFYDKYCWSDGGDNFEMDSCSHYYALGKFDWLDKNHFDYRGLIPKGLANDATGLNIY